MRRLLLLGLVFPAALLAQSGAQEEPQAPGLFGETVDVLVVNIETVVTDKEGNRVPGLTREDFRLLIDGRETPIDYFTEIRDGHATAMTPGEGAELVVSAAEPMATNYLIFIDDFFALGAHRDLVLHGLEQQLAGLGEKDKVAIVAYDGVRASMLVGWTDDREEVREGFEKARKRRARGAQRIAEARMFTSEPASNIDGEIDASLSAGVTGSTFVNSGATIDAYYPLLSRQIERLVDAATASLRGSLPPPGRKVALLVAGGWASGPLLELTRGALDPGVAGREILDRQDDILAAGLWYRPLVDTANLLGYTLYPIDAPGAGWGGADVGMTDPRLGFRSSERNIEYTLKQLADETGGRPMLNGLRSAALETAIEDTRSYYWLGFSAAREGTGQYHEIHVEMVRDGLRARARESFRDISRREEAVMTVEAGLILGESEDMGDLEVTFGETRKGDARRTVEALLEVRVPFEDLDLLEVDGRFVAIFEVSLGARDKRNVVSNILTFPVQMELLEPPPPQAHARFPIRAIVRKERHEFVVTVRDSIGGDVFIRRLPFDPKSRRKAPTVAADL